jgi:hypothetical protein
VTEQTPDLQQAIHAADERDHFQAGMHRMRDALDACRQERLTWEQANDEFFDGYQQAKKAFGAALLARDLRVAGSTPDLQQAIHAATETLDANYDWDGYDVPRIARYAVEAAWDILVAPLADLEREVNLWTAAAGMSTQELEQLQAAQAEITEVRRERDLAIAHDRQPYPTAWAYEQASNALQAAHAEVERLQDEVRWANDLLDRYGAPKTIYNPYDRIDQPLNIAGRISKLVDPANKGFGALEREAAPEEHNQAQGIGVPPSAEKGSQGLSDGLEGQ